VEVHLAVKQCPFHLDPEHFYAMEYFLKFAEGGKIWLGQFREHVLVHGAAISRPGRLCMLW
jgi:hypothetical protein